MSLRIAAAASPLRGDIVPPGDKSISHRALILASLARGESRISGLLNSADTRATLSAMEQMGASFLPNDEDLLVRGLGAAVLAPGGPLDMGNSGTAMRLLAGVLAAQPFDSVLVGDASLSGRPMRRILKPLREMGARIESTAAGTAPLVIRGARLAGIDYDSPVASAQVKSCVLLAGLYAQGTTRVREPGLSRDHTERMLPLFGVELLDACGVAGGSPLLAADVEVPADPSSAAFLAVAALLVEGSDIVLRNVGLNDTRKGFFRAVQAMGANLEFGPERMMGAEPVGDIRIRHHAGLSGIDLPPAWIPSMIDEIPAFMVLASRARGVSRIRGAAELRVKESDRLAVMSAGLRALGVTVAEYPDGVDVSGGAGRRGGVVDAAGDHRCAMSFAVLGLDVRNGVEIRNSRQIDTSYPGFVNDMNSLGADMSQEPFDDHGD